MRAPDKVEIRYIKSDEEFDSTIFLSWNRPTKHEKELLNSIRTGGWRGGFVEIHKKPYFAETISVSYESVGSFLTRRISEVWELALRRVTINPKDRPPCADFIPDIEIDI